MAKELALVQNNLPVLLQCHKLTVTHCRKNNNQQQGCKSGNRQLEVKCLVVTLIYGAGIGGRVPTWRIVSGSSSENLALDEPGPGCGANAPFSLPTLYSSVQHFKVQLCPFSYPTPSSASLYSC